MRAVRTWSRRWFGRPWPYLLSGVLCTLFMAWAMPLLLAMRGLGPSSWSERPQLLVANHPMRSSRGAWLEVRRAIFSDWCVVESVGTAQGRKWPDGTLFDADAGLHRAPLGCVVAPREAERDRYGRIDTGLSGWPFRAFASEAWYRATPPGGYEPMPELRWNWHIGAIDGQLVLVALRPLPLGLAADILFWTCASWVVVAAPRAIRRRRREHRGRCGSCGHQLDAAAPTAPGAVCPECGAPTPHDPLGFASTPEMLFQNAYVWFVFVSSLDIMLTWKILDRGGMEVNPVAALVIDHWGMHGAIAFKFALMMFVIVTCEISGRIRPRTGRALSIAAVVVSAAPVAWSLFLLALHEFAP
jgi:hypothetical protein